MDFDAVLGIDPGKLGAYAVLSINTGELLAAYPMQDDPKKMQRLLRDVHRNYPRLMLALEKARAGGFNGISVGVKSMFTYGKHIGHLEAVIELSGLPCQQMDSHIWTKEIHTGFDGDGPKDKSRKVATFLWGEERLKFPRSRVPNAGIIDAALIAEYVRRRVK